MVSFFCLSAMFIFLTSPVISLSRNKRLDGIETSKVNKLSDNVWINQESQCPLLFRYKNATGKCECYIDEAFHKDAVKCSKEGEALIRYNDCITYDGDSDTISLGFCPYFEIQGHIVAEPGFVKLPDNISDLNSYMCEPMNRKGLLCGECKDGYGLSATSPKLKCSKCTMNIWLALLSNLLLETIPVFIFYIVLLAFQISITSPPMPSFVLLSNLSLIIVNYNLFYRDETFYAANAITTFYGVWTLDFFHLIVPPFCISPHLNSLHIHYIRSISTVFPFVLIALTCLSIELYSRNFKLVVWTWKTLNCILLKHIKVERDTSGTVIDTFATFFLLSFAKLTLALLLPLHPLPVHEVNNTDLTASLRINSLTYPGDKFLSREHLPLVIPSLFIFLFVLLPPVFILTLYPFKAFRLLLFKCFPQRFKGYLNIFVEKYYYCYKDGLNSGRDMRSFAALYFFVILLGYMSWTIHKSYFLIGLLLGGCGVTIAIVQPYKKRYMTIADTLIFANMATVSFAFDRNIYALAPDSFHRIIIIICCLLPLFGLACFILYKLFSKPLGVILYALKTQLKPMLYCSREDGNRNIEEGVEEEGNLQQSHHNDHELPDRMHHPKEYTHQQEEATY